MDKVMVSIIHERAITDEVLELLQEQGIGKYTAWQGVQGIGQNGPHLGTPVWPALNTVTMVVIDSDRQGRLLEAVRGLQEEYPYIGLRAVVTPVLEMV